MREDLSEYAEKNKDEFIAEAWMEYRNSATPGAVAKKVGEYLVSLLKGR